MCAVGVYGAWCHLTTASIEHQYESSVVLGVPYAIPVSLLEGRFIGRAGRWAFSTDRPCGRHSGNRKHHRSAVIRDRGGNVNVHLGDYVSGNDGLNDAYRFFFEVGPGTNRLVVELFDADVVAGAAATEEANERDVLLSSKDTFARYRLFDPDGNQVATQFGVGSGSSPIVWDNAWTTLFDSDTATVAGGDTFADNFDTDSYGNDDGTENWAGDWTEEQELGTAGPSGGTLKVTGGQLSIDNTEDPSPFTSKPGVYRQVDLSMYTAAVLSFDWDTGIGMEDNDAVTIEASADDGVTYVGLDVLTNFASGASSGSQSYDISPYLSASTRIRIRVFDFMAGAGEAFLVDNLIIRAVTSAGSNTPSVGHWELRVDQSTAIYERIPGQNDINAFGVRAHDGTSGSGGDEINVYASSFVGPGINSNDRTRSYTWYPYITEGCSLDIHDFDFDANMTDPDGPGGIDPPYGSWALTSRSSGFSDDDGGVMSNSGSMDTHWLKTNVTGWTSRIEGDDYGIWTMDASIADFATGNYATMYVGSPQAVNAFPTSSPENGAYRIYFPSDAGAAPAKPYFSQHLNYVAGNGPNPALMGSSSRFAVELRVTNPAGAIGPITFDGMHLVTANIPGDTAMARARFAGIKTGSPSAGSVSSQPVIGSTVADDIEWNPGVIPPGTTATLKYFIDVEPLVATDPLTIPVTGSYGSFGSVAEFIDETGHATASVFFGDLCGLDVLAGPGAMTTPVPVELLEFVVD